MDIPITKKMLWNLIFTLLIFVLNLELGDFKGMMKLENSFRPRNNNNKARLETKKATAKIDSATAVSHGIHDFPLKLHHMYGLWEAEPPNTECDDYKLTQCMTMKPEYRANLHACAYHASNMEIIMWNASSLEKFISKHEPWFLDTWRAYPYPVQRADSARYIILYHLGGVYMDIDITCTQDLNQLLGVIATSKHKSYAFRPTDPVGFTNAFMITKKGTQFMRYMIDGLTAASGWKMFTPYFAVMCSTGPLHMSIRYNRFANQNPHVYKETYRINDTEYNSIYFTRVEGSGWHSYDAFIIVHLFYNNIVFTYFFCCMVTICVFMTLRYKLYSKYPYVIWSIVFAVLLFFLWLFYQVSVCITR